MMRVAISAGHYPDKPGANFYGFYEHWEAQSWARLIVTNLLTLGVAAFEVTNSTLSKKVKQINNMNCCLALEIHFNAGAVTSGCETLYYPRSVKGKQFAEVVQEAMVNALEIKDRGVKEGWYKMDRPGVIDFYGDKDGDEMPDYFLKATHCPSIILEPEFISQILTIQRNREKTCVEIAAAVKVMASSM